MLHPIRRPDGSPGWLVESAGGPAPTAIHKVFGALMLVGGGGMFVVALLSLLAGARGTLLMVSFLLLGLSFAAQGVRRFLPARLPVTAGALLGAGTLLSVPGFGLVVWATFS